MRNVVAALFSWCVCLSGAAAEPTDSTLERFLNAYQFEPIREAWAFRLDREIKAELGRLRATSGLSEAARGAIEKYQAAVATELQSRLSPEHLRPRYAAIFRKTFTEEEMLEITRFYESQAGKASVQRRQQIAARIQEQFTGLAEEMSRNLAGVRKEVEQAVATSQKK